MNITGVLTYLRRLRRHYLGLPQVILVGRAEYDIIPMRVLPWAKERQAWICGN